MLPFIAAQVFTIDELNNDKVFVYLELRKFRTPSNEIKQVACKWFSNLYNPNPLLYTKHKMTYSGDYNLEYSKTGEVYRCFNWADIPKDIKGKFLVPITYSTAYKKIFNGLKILEIRRDFYKDSEFKKHSFSRLLCEVN